MLKPVGSSTNAFYVVDGDTLNPLAVITYADLNQNITHGEELRVYFGATAAGNANGSKTPANKGVNESHILIFGRCLLEEVALGLVHHMVKLFFFLVFVRLNIIH